MPAHETPSPPPTPVCLYPRRCFPPLRQHSGAAVHDHLLAHVVGKIAPPARRPLRKRPAVGAMRSPSRWRNGPTLREATRRWNDLLGIWRHCDAATCRLARRCNGDPLACLPRYVPLLPPAIGLWFACVGMAAEQNVSFAQALTFAEREGAHAICRRWHAALRAALSRGRQSE